jgi:hypothetical protein
VSFIISALNFLGGFWGIVTYEKKNFGKNLVVSLELCNFAVKMVA